MEPVERLSAELRDAVARMESENAESRRHFEEARRAFAEGRREFEEGRREFEEGRREFAEGRRELQTAVARMDARMDALHAETLRQFDETRRHFDVVAESLRGDVRLLAEGITGKADRSEVDELRTEVRGELAEVRSRLRRLERSQG